MNAADHLREAIDVGCTRDDHDHVAMHRAEVIAERDAQIITWLVKKAREFRANGKKTQANTAAVLASKVERGAVRSDNLRMLPANFFEPGHSYTSSVWKFRCEAITPSPTTGEPRALGWQLSPVNGTHLWHAVALDPDDWTHGGWTDTTEDGAQ